MLFNSYTFFIFFLVFYFLYLSIKDKKQKIKLITISSYIFYGFWNSPFVLLLLISTIADYNIGKYIFRAQDSRKRKTFLRLSLLVNLGMLFFFKYFNLFTQTGIGLLALFGISWEVPYIHIILPVGISFYTFQTLSYTIDIYYKKIEPENDIWTFAAFVSFFPQLVAGPILRAKDFLPQFVKNRTFSWEIFYQGFYLIIFGLFKKMVIADNLAVYVERVYDNNFLTSFSDAWVSTLAFTFQIYMDFSGYSDIAIGLGLLLGFYIPDNFNSPYAARSFSEFWRRWHISLSSWLRDYLYIPLGGNRKSKFRTNINLLITMLLGGLWHGAAWNFVVWGFMHGIYLLVERSLGLNNFKSPNLFIDITRKIIVFILVLFTWVMFRADISKATEIIRSMFGFENSNAINLLSTSNVIGILALSASILLFQYYFAKKNLIDVFNGLKFRKETYVIVISVLIFFILTFKGEGGAFIYFQF